MSEVKVNACAYLIDASIYIFRYYFSLPDHWWTEDGKPTAAVYGYATWLLKLIKTQQPEKIAACFDESLQLCFRNDIYAAYKSSRALPDELLAFQLSACKTISELLGVPCYASNRYEADDLLATLAKRCRDKGTPVCIVSRDKDLAQLVINAADFMWDFPGGEKQTQVRLTSKLGFPPHQMADFLALTGDSIDDIPGVAGVGAKTASVLMQKFSGWRDIANNLDKLSTLEIRGAKSLAEKLGGNREQISMALQLTRLVNNAPLGRRYSVKPKKPDITGLKLYAKELGFGKNFSTLVDKVFDKK
ncbi:5'-3' exonuclease [Alteromonadaceae bacterium Bs31]|nr:5'-3' exonuclease [Alteromonadaceae bacterium Bs31]